MGVMGELMRAFLNIVQPNAFPANLAIKIVQNGRDALFDVNTMKELLWYEMGFLVCTGLGLLYMVLMPLFAAGFVVGRHRGKEKLAGRTEFKKRALCIVTVMIVFGNIHMFISNGAFKVDLDQIQGALNNLHTYFTAVPENIGYVVNEIYKIVDEMTENLHTIGFELGMKIQKSFETAVGPALRSVEMMANLGHVNATTDLGSLNSTLNEMIRPSDKFRGAIGSAKGIIEDAHSDCKNEENCEQLIQDLKTELESSKYVDIFEFGYINQSLRNFQEAVEAVKWGSLHEGGKVYLMSILQNVTNDTNDVVQPMKTNLENIKTQLSQLTSDFLISVSTNVTDTLQQLQTNIGSITPEVDRAENITRAVGVVLCCMILLVVACNILGLVLGPLGLEPKADPKDRSGTAHYGGNFLLMGAGFIFLFSWLLMVVVLLLFVPGGNIYALVCKPWYDRELLEIIDTPSLIGFELGLMLGLKNNLTLTDVYNDCQKNRSLWSTLHMNELINLEEPLNMSQYTDVILSNVSITPIMLLSYVENEIETLHAQAKNINFTAFTLQIDMIRKLGFGTMKRNLMVYDKGALTPNIGSLVNALGDAHNWAGMINFTVVGNLNPTTEKLKSNVNEIIGKVSEVLSKMGTAQDFLDNYTTQIIKTENRDFVDRHLGNVTVTYAEWANLTQQVGRCGPVAGAVDLAENIICEDIVESLNTFWFSLSLCLIFFIPSIIFSIKLAKYYRTMEESDKTVDKLKDLSIDDEMIP